MFSLFAFIKSYLPQIDLIGLYSIETYYLGWFGVIAIKRLEDIKSCYKHFWIIV